VSARRGRLRRKRPPRVVFVVACSERKRSHAADELRLRSVDARDLRDRAMTWRKRLRKAEVSRVRADSLYAGEHWTVAADAYRHLLRWNSRSELWVVSAGHGLIRADTPIASYSATFASGHADSVWRGSVDGDRRSSLLTWWDCVTATHLAEIVADVAGSPLVVAAGCAYVDALDADLDSAIAADETGERVAVVSAGAERSARAFLPVGRGQLGLVGGTVSALNARVLRLLALTADDHHFRVSSMAAVLKREAATASPWRPPVRAQASDAEIARAVLELRSSDAKLSRTKALQAVRAAGVACEQHRFARIWVAAEALTTPRGPRRELQAT
jgi:hypothetical protein